MATMATSVPWRPKLRFQPPPVASPPRATPYRRHPSSAVSFPIVAPIRAFGRSDFEGFARRVTSGEAFRDALRGASDGIEQLAFEARRTAERLDRRYSLSRRFDSAARAASVRAREIDQEFGIGQRWRSFSVDFSRNWPKYEKELNSFVRTPLGRGFGSIFLLWFILSGWMFRIFILATWILPFAAPFLIGKLANNLSVIEGSCPACQRRFMGVRNMTICCTGCGNIVWQPKTDSSRGSSGSGPDIIDIEIEEK